MSLFEPATLAGGSSTSLLTIVRFSFITTVITRSEWITTSWFVNAASVGQPPLVAFINDRRWLDHYHHRSKIFVEGDTWKFIFHKLVLRPGEDYASIISLGRQDIWVNCNSPCVYITFYWYDVQLYTRSAFQRCRKLMELLHTFMGPSTTLAGLIVPTPTRIASVPVVQLTVTAVGTFDPFQYDYLCREWFEETPIVWWLKGLYTFLSPKKLGDDWLRWFKYVHEFESRRWKEDENQWKQWKLRLDKG